MGPYSKSKPIQVSIAMIDGENYTNKVKLMLNWKWNFDISGIDIDDFLLLKPDAAKVVIQYTSKYTNCKEILDARSCVIDVCGKSVKIDRDKEKKILFGEIHILENI